MADQNVKIGVSANTSDVERKITDLAATISALNAKIEGAGQSGDKGLLKSLKRQNDAAKELKKTIEGIANVARTGGNVGISYAEIERAAARLQGGRSNPLLRKRFAAAGGLEALSGEGASPEAIRLARQLAFPGSGGGRGVRGGFGRQLGGAFGAVVGQLAPSAMRPAMNAAGSAVAGAGEAVAAGEGLGAPGIVGGGALSAGILALGAGGMIALGRGGKNRIEGFSDLRRRQGDLNVSYSDIESGVTGTGHKFGLTDEQFTALSNAFLSASGGVGGIGGANYSQRLAFGYGADPSQMAGAMGLMARRGGPFEGDGAKRIGVEIADALNRNGLGASIVEFSQAVGQFMQTSRNFGSGSGNPLMYANLLASVANHETGGDIGAASSLLGGADASYRNGGGFGDASKNYIMAMNMRRLGGGASPFDALALQKMGLFANSGDIKNTAYGRLTGFGGGSSGNALDDLMSRFAPGSGKVSGAALNQMGNLFGMDQMQAAQLIEAYRKSGGAGGLSKMLEAHGLSSGNINAASLADLAKIETSSGGDLKGFAQKYLDSSGLSEAQKSTIKAAEATGKDDDLRKALVGISNANGPLGDLGTESKAQSATLTDIKAVLEGKIYESLHVMSYGLVQFAARMTGADPSAFMPDSMDPKATGASSKAPKSSDPRVAAYMSQYKAAMAGLGFKDLEGALNNLVGAESSFKWSAKNGSHTGLMQNSIANKLEAGIAMGINPFSSDAGDNARIDSRNDIQNVLNFQKATKTNWNNMSDLEQKALLGIMHHSGMYAGVQWYRGKGFDMADQKGLDHDFFAETGQHFMSRQQLAVTVNVNAKGQGSATVQPGAQAAGAAPIADTHYLPQH